MSSIVLFTSEFPFGKQETFLENEISFLSERFEKVTIIPLFQNGARRDLEFANVEVATPVNSSRKFSLHKLSLIYSKTFWIKFFLGLKNANFNPKFLIKVLKQAIIVSRVKKYLKKRPSFFEASGWYFYWGTNSVNVLPFLKKHPKSVARYHRYDLYGPEIAGGEYQLFQEETLKKLNKAICISEDGEKYLKSKYSNLSDKVVLSRLGVPDRGINVESSDDIFRIVSCSNLYTVKRVHLLAQALKLVCDIKVEWTHMGDGPKPIRQKLFNETTKLSSNIKFNFLGRLPNSKIIDYYKDHCVDVFVNTSISEGAPVSIMEAMSFGIPIIATNCGGVSELVSSDNGSLLGIDVSPGELALKIQEMYHCKNRKEKRDFSRLEWQKKSNSQVNYKEFSTSIFNK